MPDAIYNRLIADRLQHAKDALTPIGVAIRSPVVRGDHAIRSPPLEPLSTVLDVIPHALLLNFAGAGIFQLDRLSALNRLVLACLIFVSDRRNFQSFFETWWAVGTGHFEPSVD